MPRIRYETGYCSPVLSFYFSLLPASPQHPGRCVALSELTLVLFCCDRGGSRVLTTLTDSSGPFQGMYFFFWLLLNFFLELAVREPREPVSTRAVVAVLFYRTRPLKARTFSTQTPCRPPVLFGGTYYVLDEQVGVYAEILGRGGVRSTVHSALHYVHTIEDHGELLLWL